jgi:hypothetical protein
MKHMKALFGIRNESVQELQDILVRQVQVSDVEGVVQTLKSVIARLRPDGAKRDSDAFRLFSGMISRASQAVAMRTPQDNDIQSFLLSAMMGSEAFNRKVRDYRLEAQFRMQHAARPVAEANVFQSVGL